LKSEGEVTSLSGADKRVIVDALQTNYTVVSLAGEKWNVWRIALRLLPASQFL
jgi:hypothetical protein